MRPQEASTQLRANLIWAAVIFALTLASFAYNLGGEAHFIDESAYISQSYYFDVFFGRARDDPAWLDFPAQDQPPLVKYLIGSALWLGGHPRPGPADARAWYRDQSYRPETSAALVWARGPSTILGAIGCVAIFGLGVMASGRGVGVLAAVLLAADPLYRSLARRAMCDVPATALALATVTVAIWSWRRMLSSRWHPACWSTAAVVAGLLGGLAVLAKFSGGLGLMSMCTLCFLTLILSPLGFRRGVEATIASTLLASWIAFGTFVTLNPHVTARPAATAPPEAASSTGRRMFQRIEGLLRVRESFSRKQQGWSPSQALITTGQKLAAITAQGFGRYGTLSLLDGRRGPNSDRLAWLWLPWVIAGATGLATHGLAQFRAGTPPIAWAVLLAAAVDICTVTAYIPMAWDRYFLPLQPWSALLAAYAFIGLGQYTARAGRRAIDGAFVTVAALGLVVMLARLDPMGDWHAVFVSDLPWTAQSNGWGPVERDASNGESGSGDGRQISLNGVTYARGLGVHAGSEVRVRLNGSYDRFLCEVGVDDEVGQAGSVAFEVWADGIRLYASGTMFGGSRAKSVSVDLIGRQELKLVVSHADDDPHQDHAAWAGARLIPVKTSRATRNAATGKHHNDR